MFDQDRLFEFAESYLKSLIAEAAGTLNPDFDSVTPFGELGIDSFRVLKIVKALETDFGTLPKTLLFENFNVNDLARYFVDKHAHTLSQKLAGEGSAAPAGVTAKPAQPIVAPARAQLVQAPAQPILMLEKDARADPELGAWVKEVFDRYKNDGSVSRGTRNIAPNLFIGSDRKGYFHYARSNKIILAYTWTGPIENFAQVALEFYEYCKKKGFELNLLAADELTSIGSVSWSSTPFGVLQRVVNLQEFKLEGQAMRRLRYQVSKFEKAGNCRTEEFICGSDPEISGKIADMIDAWCAGRTMVNPLIHIVKDEILAGTLDREHRIFLTYIDEVLQNAILISPLSAEMNGYLMDLEFYHKSMPLGGLEYTIINIVRTLVAEGCNVLSLGGTYGCKLEESTNADPDIDKILNDLRMQNIFNDEGNLQFKNKFRPENKAIYLCRPAGMCDPHNVIDVIMMIADPMKMQTSDESNQHCAKTSEEARAPQRPDTFESALVDGMENVAVASGDLAASVSQAMGIDGQERSFILAESGFNPLNIHHEQIDFDLKTDSWAQLQLPAIDNQIRHLHGQLQQPVNLEQVLKDIFPFRHFALTASGRTAESVFYKAWQKKGVVLQNLLFPTTLFHQIDKGFTPCELPNPEVFRLDSNELFKGGVDLLRLQQHLDHDAAGVAMVCLELSNNASGGCPVSLAHLKQVKALLTQYGVALVIDGTRILENARFVIGKERGYAGKTVWQVAAEIFAQADVVVVSLAKDFCVQGGGLIATNDAGLLHRLQEAIREEGCGLNGIDKKLLALSLRDRQNLEVQSGRRQLAVQRICSALRHQGIPLAQQTGGHCILLDVMQMPEFRSLHNPLASFLSWLYIATGIRASAHNAGMQKDTVLNGLVRLAIPIGLKDRQVEEIIQRIGDAFADKRNIPEVESTREGGASIGDIHARYSLVQYHRPTGLLLQKSALPTEAKVFSASMPENRQAAAQPVLRKARTASREIAIVGMAGRYPGAKNLRAMWNNLVRGVDCIGEVPEERLAQRVHNDFTRRYRGGFIDDVDCFDAAYFSISARDAAIMDPQERVFLEVACEAVEDAGYYPEILAAEDSGRNIGVFVGAVWSSYQMIGAEEKIAGNNVNPSSFLWSIANRVSYWMNFSGPSMTVDTACSASLTAIKLACDAINNGECQAAIAGGVNLDLHQGKFDINSAGGSLSEDGVCRSYGKGANGYVSGEGAGALLLKSMEQAIADGDQIYGVIKSAVVTHSGRTSAYTIPNPRTQSTLISKALELAQIDARTIGYIEGHGTGTDLGDSIEIAGLAASFEKYQVPRQSCAIGSIKSAIGHLEAASGIVGLQKILLQMKHRKLVPSLHSSELNGNIDFANSPFRVQQEVEEWQAKEVDGIRYPRRAGISAIGIGGANAHILLEEYVDPTSPPVVREAEVERIFPLSARSAEQLRLAAIRLRDFLEQEQELASESAEMRLHLNDIAYTLLFGRKSYDHRLAVVASSVDELIGKLTSFVEGEPVDGIMAGHVKDAHAVSGLLNTREKQDFVNLLVQSRDPSRMAQLWSNGVITDWQGLDVGLRGKRVSLPTYPFARERHWIVERKAVGLELANTTAKAAPVPAGRETSRNVHSESKQRYCFSIQADFDELAGTRLETGSKEKAVLFVRQLFADQLNLSVNEVDPHMQLMESGVTSLDMAEMTRTLKDSIDHAFSPTIFFECFTLAAFADLLAQKYESVFQSMVVTKTMAKSDNPYPNEVIKAIPLEGGSDLCGKQLHLQDAEMDLALPAPDSLLPVRLGKPRAVLLTGATGFLGIHVLSELLATNPELTVFCVVRTADETQGMQRIRQQAEHYEQKLDEARITVLCGDTNQPRLGLSQPAWERCCLEVDQIVHASAHVNHIEGYATFRESAQGMKEVIRLAGTHHAKLIQFISSTAACFQKNGDEFSVFDKEDFIETGELVYGGYGQSKWVQETFLKRAATHGIPYAIYRFGELSGSSHAGLGQTDDMVHRLIQMRLAIGCREKISSDVLDMLPVDFAARLIVGTGRTPELWNRIVHATHLKPYSFANMYRRAQMEDLRFDPVTREQYLSKCYDFVQYIYSLNPVNGFVLECVLRDAEGATRNRKIMDGYFAVLFPFAQDNFKQSLLVLDLALPEWKVLIDRYFQRWSSEDCGFMATIYGYRKWCALGQKTAQAVVVTLEDEAILKFMNDEESILENISEV